MRPLLTLKTLVAATLLTLLSVTAASGHFKPVIDGWFVIQPYELPNDQGYRHISAATNKLNHELIIYGGLGNGFGAGVPVNNMVYTLDLTEDPSEQDWDERSVDEVVPRPWFTSTRGFIQIDDDYYVTCDDSDDNGIYKFDPQSYEFETVTASTLGPELSAGDCCAVGVTVPARRHHGHGHHRGRSHHGRSHHGHSGHGNHHTGSGDEEERIYVLGGRNDVEDPASFVRYYSITHDEWVQVDDMHVGRSHLGCVATEQKGEPLIYAIGGGNGPVGEALRSMEVYNVLDNEWTLYEDFLPEGRTRLAVQNVKNKQLLLIGGDSTCAGGGAGNMCASDQPLTTVEVVDIKRGNHLISDVDRIPQLNLPRQTPGTALIESRAHHHGRWHGPRYMLYVIGGRTRTDAGLDVLTSTEVLSFDRIRTRPR